MERMLVHMHRAKVVYPGSDWDNQYVDLIIEDGILKMISSEEISIDDDQDKVFLEDVIVGPSLCDMWSAVGEPGFEFREDWESLRKAAISGGYGHVSVVPNTDPVLDHKNLLKAVLDTNIRQLCQVHPLAALSKGAHSAEMTEQLDISTLGIRNFSDGLYTDHSVDYLERVGYYLNMFQGRMHCHLTSLERLQKELVHQSKISTSLGLSGYPSWLEQDLARKYVNIARETGVKVHLVNVSSADTVPIIREAKDAGLHVVASVAIMNLIYTDNDLQNFDERLKVNPPLRASQDREALVDGLKEGTLDAINTNHMPLSIEEKNIEFPYADFGAINLQTCFPQLLETDLFSEEELIRFLALKPRDILGLKMNFWKVGEEIELMVWKNSEPWVFSAHTNRSKSSNSILMDKTFSSRVLGLIGQGRMWLADR